MNTCFSCKKNYDYIFATGCAIMLFECNLLSRMCNNTSTQLSLRFVSLPASRSLLLHIWVMNGDSLVMMMMMMTLPLISTRVISIMFVVHGHTHTLLLYLSWCAARSKTIINNMHNITHFLSFHHDHQHHPKLRETLHKNYILLNRENVSGFSGEELFACVLSTESCTRCILCCYNLEMRETAERNKKMCAHYAFMHSSHCSVDQTKKKDVMEDGVKWRNRSHKELCSAEAL